jgi:hypothetical protein
MSATDTEIEDTLTAVDDQAGREASEDAPETTKFEAPASRPGKAARRVSLSLRTIVVALVICLLAATAAVFGWLYLGAHNRLAAQALETSNEARAEGIASDYAVHAAEMNYQDFGAWKVNLVNGTSQDLKDKLLKAADSMEQVLTPLQWQSSAKPLATKVRSDAGGVYTVDSFVSVLTKTMQAPEGLQSTATYSVTIDNNANWQITDVGGIDSALGK